ncbi:MAG TPA: 5'-nucleotidase C-terminal domain-containing protein, partial [Anaerolineales bacterium]|nr:5'-nucleotidase C-terminal domain-containing protein [Anaerolineales bacterium]
IGSEYEELEPARLYRVITNNFMMGGGDGYFVMTTAGDRADPSVGGGVNQLDTGFIDADVSSAYVTANSPLTPLVEGRIVELIDRQIMIGIFKDFSFATP